MIDMPTRYPVRDIPAKDLPLWMRQARQRIDWGILVVIFFSLLAAWPFIVQNGLPHTNASENYVYMTANTAEALREGRLYARWSAPALVGYGAPIPHYQPPGAAYTAALFELLITADSVNAVRLLYILSILLTGVMTYTFVTRWGGVHAGILSSMLILYSPYIGLTAPHILGALPETMALALFPTLLWSIHRLLWEDYPADLLWVALVMAALILCHVQLAAVGAGLGLFFGIMNRPRVHHWRRHAYLIAALIFGAALSGFFWIPALLETHAVSWHAPVYSPRVITLHWQDFFKPLARVDLGELNPLPQLRLGMGLLGFVVVGIIAGLRTPHQHRLFLLFALAGVGLSIIALVFIPQKTWMMGAITFCLSIAGGASTHLQNLLPQPFRRLWLVISVGGILILAYPVWLVPRWPEEFGATDANTQIQYEQQGFGIASAVPGTTLPLTISPDIAPNQSLISSYQEGEPVRILQNRLLPGRRISLISAETHSDHYLLNNTSTDPLTVLRANFPGWQATMDGDRLPLKAEQDTGLIVVNIPAIRDGDFRLTLGPTSVRTNAWRLTWFTLLLLLALTLGGLRRRRRRHYRPYIHRELLASDEARLLGILCGGFLMCIAFFATPYSPYTLHARPGYSLDSSTALRIRTDAGLEALAYSLSSTEFNLGDTLDLMLAWRASRSILQNYSVRIILQDAAQGLSWQETNVNYPGGYPTRRWETNRFVRDKVSLHLPDTLRPGEYQIAVELIDCTLYCLPENRAFYFSPDGTLLGQKLILPQTITIKG